MPDMTDLSDQAKEELLSLIDRGDGSDPNCCWLWRGGRHGHRYGRWRNWSVTRLIWNIHHGPIPDKYLVCHHCDNPPCCRIDHLFLGTHKDNRDDAVRKGRLDPYCTRGKTRRWKSREPVRARVVTMKLMGYSIYAIAKELGIQRKTARRYWRQHQDDLPKHRITQEPAPAVIVDE